jgi:hypothetical protein
MKRSCVWTALLASSLLAMACGGDDDMANGDCSGDVPSFEEVELFDKCTTCHDSKKTGNARIGAPPGVDFDTEAGALKSAMKGADEVMDGDMPPPTLGIEVTDAEKQALYEFAACAE